LNFNCRFWNHTFFISRLRPALDVVVAPAAKFRIWAVSQTFWPWWEQLPANSRPALVRAHCSFGNEQFLVDYEAAALIPTHASRMC
jgi:hypothetical protein